MAKDPFKGKEKLEPKTYERKEFRQEASPASQRKAKAAVKAFRPKGVKIN